MSAKRNSHCPSRSLSLLFPQWQGAGDAFDVYEGALLIGKQLGPTHELVRVDVDAPGPLTLECGVWGYRQLLRQVHAAQHVIAGQQPERILTIGGDCSVEIAPVAFLNARYQGNLAILWCDAHGDLNTPESSPSQLFHGMPLRVLLGEGEDEFLRCAVPPLHPAQVYLAGTRDLDPDEDRYITQHQIPVFSVETLTHAPSELMTRLTGRGVEHLYVHIDLDVLSVAEFPSVKCPTPGGIGVESLWAVLAELAQRFSIVGLSVVEYTPPPDFAGLETIQSLLRVGWRK